MEELFSEKRLQELASRADSTGRCFFTPFLTPPEADTARLCARRAGVNCFLSGGYEGAERVIACFTPEEEPPEFPLKAIAFTWPRQSAPAHRDMLGAAMALGLKRSCLGDIVVEDDRAVLFSEQMTAETVASSLTEAGRIHLQSEILPELPALAAPEGEEVHTTVLTPRLDAVLSDGFGLSRARAAETIAAGAVKLRHVPTVKCDARVAEGDAITLRGFGRLRVEEIGQPTKKGRLPVRLTRFSEKHRSK